MNFNNNSNQNNNKSRFNIGNNDLLPGVNTPFNFENGNNGNQIGPNHPNFSTSNTRRLSTFQPHPPGARFDPYDPNVGNNSSTSTGEPNPDHFKPPESLDNTNKEKEDK